LWHESCFYNKGTFNVNRKNRAKFGNDPDRVWYLLQNLSANIIYVGPDEGVSSTRGVILAGNGGLISYSARTDYIMPTLQVIAVASAANSNLLVFSMRRIALLDGTPLGE